MCAEVDSAVPDERTTTTQASAAAGGSLRYFRIARTTATGMPEDAIWESTCGEAGGASHVLSLVRTASASPRPADGFSSAAPAQRSTHSSGSPASLTLCMATASGMLLSADGKLPFRGWCHTLPPTRSDRSGPRSARSPARPARSARSPRSALSAGRSPLTSSLRRWPTSPPAKAGAIRAPSATPSAAPPSSDLLRSPRCASAAMRAAPCTHHLRALPGP
mmetsp:Transcript_17086/g.53525  ORF Transcript_17086/g.53525 Transcript_17086/m.53525 type:complete len:220 (+) Transcript_17086:525-1184(+)